MVDNVDVATRPTCSTNIELTDPNCAIAQKTTLLLDEVAMLRTERGFPMNRIRAQKCRPKTTTPAYNTARKLDNLSPRRFDLKPDGPFLDVMWYNGSFFRSVVFRIL